MPCRCREKAARDKRVFECRSPAGDEGEKRPEAAGTDVLLRQLPQSAQLGFDKTVPLSCAIHDGSLQELPYLLRQELHDCEGSAADGNCLIDEVLAGGKR